MISILKKLNKKGFTLAELLIVVAIIAILVAIAVPVFASQLESSREAVDEANARSANSIATSTYLMYEGSGDLDFTFGIDDNGNLGLTAAPTDSSHDASTTGKLGKTFDGTTVTGSLTPKSAACNGKTLTVTVDDGVIVANNWLTALS